ncbi:MAG: hypothetical protein AAFQ32_00625 [Pseudomonadota bacterium]
MSIDGRCWERGPRLLPSSLAQEDAINIGVRKPEGFHQSPMLSTADKGVQNLIDTVSKVMGGKPEGETPKRRSLFPNRDGHES